MKAIKFFFVFLMLSASSMVLAQLKVDATGKAIFGQQGPASYGISISNESPEAFPFRIVQATNEKVYFIRGFSTNYDLAPGMCIDGYGLVHVGNRFNQATWNAALQIHSTQGGLLVNYIGSSPDSDGVKVKFDSTPTWPYSAYYNNNNVFCVTGTGQVYSNGNLLTSDISLKSNIETIPNSLNKVLQLRGVTFDLNFPGNEDSKISKAKATYKDIKERTPGITPEIFDQIEKEKTRKQMGVIAQEVEKVIPEVVRTREDGLKAVAYNELTGLLIEAIKEQQNQIENLKEELAAVKGNTALEAQLRASTGENNTTGISNAIVKQCKLYQNAPNPFREKTAIKYFLPQDVQQASVCIFDMQGKLLKKINAPAGENTLIIKGSELHAGMYLYSLIADGKEMDTKRMILTK